MQNSSSNLGGNDVRANSIQEPGKSVKGLLLTAIFVPTCVIFAGWGAMGLMEAGLPVDKFALPILLGLFLVSIFAMKLFLSRFGKLDPWWLAGGILINGLVVASMFLVFFPTAQWSARKPTPVRIPTPEIIPTPPLPQIRPSAPTILHNEIAASKILIPFDEPRFRKSSKTIVAQLGFPDEVSAVTDTAKTSTLAVPPAAYWNAWFDKDDKPVSNVLVRGNVYSFNLDISAFNYATLRRDKSAAAPIDPLLGAVIADETIKSLVLTIKPVISVDSGLSLINPAALPPMKVDLDKIRTPDFAAAGKYAKDPSMPISMLSAAVSAGQISPILIRADATGCASIAFAVFNGMSPLDHVVQRIIIRDPDGEAPACARSANQVSNEFTGGLDSLRDAALGTSGGPLLGDASFYIFDSEAESTVIFVDGRKGQKQSVYGWKTDSSVVDYLRTPEFQSAVDSAQQNAANNVPGSYVTLATEFWMVLFTAKSSSGTQSEAEKAEVAFKMLVLGSASPPVVVARIASSLANGKTRSLFAPLGVLGARGPQAVLDKPIVVVQPMPWERAVSSDKCIGNWTLAVPEKLQKVTDAVMDASHFPSPYQGNRIRDIASFKPYLSNASPAPASPATGLLVLAHQDQGYLWFEADANRIIKQEIKRNFSPGSVGIFSACSAAAPSNRNAELLEKLNERGVDTLIASPFTIKAEYGVRFAYAFVDSVQAATAKGERPTILELFNRAIAKTAQRFKQMNNGDYEELGLEYVLLGNPAITLCAAAPVVPAQ